MKQTRMARRASLPLWRKLIGWGVTLGVALLVRQMFGTETAGVSLAVNSFVFTDWVSMDCLDLLVNALGIAGCFNTEVQKEFNRDFAPGENVRVKFPQEWLIREGLAYTEQPINRRYTTVSCNQIFGIDFGWDSFEQALKMERSEAELRKNYMQPAMEQLAQEYESRAANWVTLNASNVVGILGTDPTDFDTSSAAARQKLVELGIPAGGDRGIFVTPSIMRLLKKSSISYFNPVIDLSKQWRTGIVGSGDSFDWYESVSLYSFTAGSVASTFTVNGAVTTPGQNTLALNITSGDVIKVGDRISIASVLPTNPRTRRQVSTTARQYVVTQGIASATGGGSANDVITVDPPFYGPGSQYQNITAYPANSATVTLWPGTTSPNSKSGTLSFAFHENAFALVGVKFDNPKESSAEIAKQYRDPETNLPLALVRMFDPVGRRWITRWDTCCGFGNLYNANLATIIAGA